VSRRSYAQYCGLARALDLVGERWTLLVVRDLALAPRRFTDLLAGLPGVGTSLLSERLRHLEDQGVVRRAVARRPASGVVYELTGDGHRLAQAMAPLATWGAARLDPDAEAELRPEWVAYALQASFRPEAAAGMHDCYEFRLEGMVFWAVVDDGTLTVTQSKPGRADFTLTTDVPTLAQLGSGLISPRDAVTSGRARFRGDPEAGERALRVLGSGAPPQG